MSRTRAAAALVAVLVVLGAVGCSSSGSSSTSSSDTLAAGGFVVVTDAWANPTSPGQTEAPLYMDISSVDGDRLTGVTVAPDVAAGVKIVDGGRGASGATGATTPATGTTVVVPDLDIPPGGTTQLTPGGYHLLLTGLVHPLTTGQKVVVTLQFQTWGPQRVEVPVQGPPA